MLRSLVLAKFRRILNRQSRERYEEWTLTLVGVPEHQWPAYRGRCSPIRWCLVDIGHDRSGPIPSIRVPPQLSLARRAAETAVKIIEGALLEPNHMRWRRALRQLMASEHESMESLRTAIGGKHYATAMQLLVDLLQWMTNGQGAPPPHVDAKWKAIKAKVQTARTDGSKQALVSWLDKLFIRNGSLGHRWTSAPTKPDRGDPRQHMAVQRLFEQTEKFSRLWKVGDADSAEAFIELFLRLRRFAMATGKQQEWLQVNHTSSFQSICGGFCRSSRRRRAWDLTGWCWPTSKRPPMRSWPL